MGITPYGGAGWAGRPPVVLGIYPPIRYLLIL
jgi:hypothetical protein